MSITYIHYGSTTFDMDKYVDVKNDDCFLKPIGGFYAVREEFADAYVSFAEGSSVPHLEEGLKSSFKFKLRHGSNVVEVHSVKDLMGLPTTDVKERMYTVIPYEPGKTEELLQKDGLSVYDIVNIHNTSTCTVKGPCPILDFEKIKESDVDAIEIFMHEDMFLYYALYGYDTPQILVLNPDIIEPL